MWRVCRILLLHSLVAAQNYYSVPELRLQAFAQGGFQVSIPDSPGVELFAFHGNLNRPLKDVDAGRWNRDVVKSRNGRWTFEEPDVRLRLGDVVYYWIFVQVDGIGYTKTNQRWTVSVSSFDVESEDRIGSHVTTGLYEVPDAKLEALYPKGLRVSIPDEPGIQLLAFHGKVNTPLSYSLEAGTMSRDVLRKKNGRWVFEDDSVRLKPGDVVYYWLYVQLDGRGYQKLDQEWVVPGPGVGDGGPVDPPTTQETVDEVTTGSAVFQLDFKLPEGMELMVVVKDGKLLLKHPLPSQIAFENAESVKIGFCKTMQICVPSVDISGQN